MEEKNNKKYWIFGGIAGAIILTNVVNYLLTSYFVGKNYKSELETKNKIVAEQKITIDSLTQSLNNKEKDLLEKIKTLKDSLESVTERKRDYQDGFEILSKCLNKEINVREKLLNVYLQGKISEKAFKWMMNNLPPYNPIKPKIPTKKK